MRAIALALIALVAAIHLWIVVLEMFLWRTRARRAFGMSQAQADATAVLAQNQGLYNGFLWVQALPAALALAALWLAR